MSFSAQSLGFQFTPLREGRPALNYTAEPFQQISIHAPPRGATVLMSAMEQSLTFQFTPLREGRRARYVRNADSAHISIHAPPRGATTLLVCNRITVEISIHAPPRGATIVGGRGRGKWLFQFTRLLVHQVQPPHFNSRPSARGDQRLAKVAFGAVISIHAPPRGATASPAGDERRRIQVISIHAPPRGATPLCLSENTTMDNFNSRPSARGDVMPDRRARWK